MNLAHFFSLQAENTVFSLLPSRFDPSSEKKIAGPQELTLFYVCEKKNSGVWALGKILRGGSFALGVAVFTHCRCIAKKVEAVGDEGNVRQVAQKNCTRSIKQPDSVGERAGNDCFEARIGSACFIVSRLTVIQHDQ